MAEKYLSQYTGQEIDNAVDRINNILDIFYPIGSIFTTTDTNETPTTLSGRMGGTWEQLKDRFLLGAGDTYTAGATGGEASHTLTRDEMPSHYGHGYDDWNWLNKGSAGGKYLASLSSYGDAPRGWDVYDGEYHPATTSLGGDKAHNNMPPYLVVKMFKRTA